MQNFKQLHLTFAGQIETVPTAADLPVVGIVVGAIRYVEDTNFVYTWDGNTWSGMSFDNLTVNSLVTNDLTVNNLAYVKASVVEIGDNIIVLHSLVTGTPTEDSGIAINRGNEPDAYFLWDEDLDTWVAGTENNLVPISDNAPTPAFAYARQGSVPTNTWLMSNGIPSNVSGVPNPFVGAEITKVFIDSGTQSTYSIEIYEHDHETFTLLGSYTVTEGFGAEFDTNLSVTQGRIFAVKLSSGSASNITVGFQLKA